MNANINVVCLLKRGQYGAAVGKKCSSWLVGTLEKECVCIGNADNRVEYKENIMTYMLLICWKVKYSYN